MSPYEMMLSCLSVTCVLIYMNSAVYEILSCLLGFFLFSLHYDLKMCTYC